MKTKRFLKLAISILIFNLILVTFTTCKKAEIATINTLQVTEIAGNTAISGGEIINDGGGDITERGICWSSMGVPTISDPKTTDGTGSGAFSSTMTDLLPGTAYQVRAYAINEAGVAYGNVLTFITKFVPTVVTTPVTDIDKNTATSGGLASSAEDSQIIARGVCWSTNATPTIADSKTSNGTGTGTFESNLTDLLPGTTYNLRAYATNEYGTGYGMTVTFTTSPGEVPIVSTSYPHSETLNTFISGGNVTNNGGSPVTERGIIWSTNYTFDISTAAGKTISGSGNGSFTCTASGLEQGTQYYVKAYATNAQGTGYGSAEWVNTMDMPSINSLTLNSASDVWAVLDFRLEPHQHSYSITESGLCWKTSSNPTVSDFHTSDLSLESGSYYRYFGVLTALTPNTTYYVRAYAITEGGTIYSESVSVTTSASFSCGTTTVDANNNTYNTVQIGNQCWMKENLKATSYNTAQPIPNQTSNSTWYNLTTPAYCWYDNNEATYGDDYGALYNGRVVETGEICPIGWHVPTDTEWTTLVTQLGGEIVAGGRLKETGTTHWVSPNTNATNSSGFSARPGGVRSGYVSDYGSFEYIGERGMWWSSTSATSTTLYRRYIKSDSGSITNVQTTKNYGLSIRCIKN